MASTRYLVLRYNQLRAKLYASSCGGDVVFTTLDNAEIGRIFDELYRREAIRTEEAA